MEWIDIKEALPPLNVLVVTKNGGEKSVGMVSEFRMGREAGTQQPTLSLSWKSQQPYIHNPTHWMHLPK